MATTIQVTKVKAADPGLGFTLQISNNGAPINDTLKVVITVDSKSSTILLNSPVTEQSLVFVMPFGDSSYVTGKVLPFSIQAYVPQSAASPLQTISGSVIADSGVFDYESSMPNSLADGSTLGPGGLMNSMGPDPAFFGIMQLDGNFCVYRQYALGMGGLQNTDSTYSDNGGNNCSIKVLGGRIFVYNNATGRNISASPANQAMPGASMVIDTNGHISLQYPGQQPVQVPVRPGNLP